MCNVPLVDEPERLEDLLEEVDDVLLEGDHVVLQDRLEVAVRGAAKKMQNGEGKLACLLFGVGGYGYGPTKPLAVPNTVVIRY